VRISPRQWRREFLALLTVGLLCAGFLIYSARADVAVSSASGTQTVTRGCVIRFDGGPHIYDKTNHACNAVQSLSVNSSGDLVLNLVGLPAGSKVLSMYAEEDETLSSKVQCGPSGGIGTTLVRCFSHTGNHVTVTGPMMNRPYANLWMGWTYEVPA
jgi:hypothetical protein